MDNANSDLIFGSDEPQFTQEEVLDPSATTDAATTVDASADSASDGGVVEADQAAPNAEEQVEAADGEETDAKSTPAPVQAAAQAKKVTFKVGDQDVPLDETAVIEHRVDGKREKITLKDLITNYAGKIPIERRMNEVAGERKKLAADVVGFENIKQRHSTFINDMHTRVQKGDTFGAVANMLEMSGSKQDPAEFIKQLRDVLMQEASQFSQMTPEQRQLFEANERNQYLQSKYERVTQMQQQKEAQAAFQQRVEGVIAQTKSSIEEYTSQKNYLEQEYRRANLNPAEITPEKVGQFIKDARDYRTAKDALAEAYPEAIKDGAVVDNKLWDTGVHLLRQNPDWTLEDLRDVYKQAAAAKRSASVSKKVAKAPIATVAAAAAKAKAAPTTTKQAQRQLMLEQKPAGYGQFSEQDLDW